MSAELPNAEPEYWRSIDEWMETTAFRSMMKDEFPEDAAEWLDPVSRRRFLGLAGASAALAGAIGCNPSLKPASQKKVVPYVKQPDQIIPGVPLFFTTAMAQAGGVGIGLLVKSHEGRPIKCEGNPNHPSSLGSLELQALAAPLTMYDPDRSKAVRRGGDATTFDKALLALQEEFAKRGTNGGEGIRLLTEPTTSPTLIGVMDELLKRYPKAKWIQYEPVNKDSATKAALAAFGKPLSPVYNLANADVILSLDADFLSGPGSVRYARDFGARRKVDTVEAVESLEHEHSHKHPKGGHFHPKWDDIVKEATETMNRLYVVEGMVTSTGAIADHRLPLKPSYVEAFTRTLAAQLGVPGITAATDLPDAAKKWIKPLAEDLASRKGKAVVIPGDHQSPAVHLLAHAINTFLGATNIAVEYIVPLDAKPADRMAEFKSLVEDMKAGKVDLLLMSGVNPTYDAPADLEFEKHLMTVKAKGPVVHHGLYQDESGYEKLATWHINAAHFFEAWGDVRGHDGTACLQQPLIAPLYQGKSFLELVVAILGYPVLEARSLVRETTAQDLMKDVWFEDAAKKESALKRLESALGSKVKDAAKDLKSDDAKKEFSSKISSTEEFEIFWQRCLRDGVIPNTKAEKQGILAAAQLYSNVVEKLNDKAFTQTPIKGLEIQYRPDPALHDGKPANNGWLQELPKPITNLTWDNAALVSPRTAEELKIVQEFAWTGGERGSTETDIVKITVNGREIEAAIHVLPAMADGVLVLHLGFGRTRAGNVANSVQYPAPPAPGGYAVSPGAGFNAYKLRGTEGIWTAALDNPVRTGKRYTLAIAGAHAAMESRRPVRHATVEEYKADQYFAQIPPASAAEFEEIRMLTPGTPENYQLLGMKSKYGHDHGHGNEEGKKHDERLKKLSLYMVNPIKVNGEEATKTYRRWAMTIDLGSCIGCSACTLACVSENNTPVVGKDQVTKGRAMHWIRIDRYYSIPGKKPMEDTLGDFKVKPADRKERAKDSAAIRVHVQPVPCQQCEKAPCEVVCPVGATTHSADGLNDMAYNRCVGTRYCANNCPYKVRRFNFLQFTDYTTESLKLLNNPEVTVRTRGVMEKCTYCTQRIRNAEIEAEREWKTRSGAILDDHGKPVLDKDGNPKRKPTEDANGRPKIMDGEVRTACQQACPTGAISFGDLNDPDSKVLKTKAEEHNYGLLAEQNTMPRTSYLAAIRNPNPNLPQGA